jgi:transposase InsO family protein
MPARLRLSWSMKSLKLFLLRVLDSLEFGWQVIHCALIFVSAFFHQRASLGCEMVAMRSQLTFCEESIRQKRQPRPRFNQQPRQAMPFGQQPAYLFRDNDGIYGDEVDRFLGGTGIEEVKTAHRCPWQNPFVERYGGTLWRELLDHVIVLNEEHLKRLLEEFIEEYYHLARPHQGLNGEAPVLSAKPVSGELIWWQVRRPM